MWLEKVANIAKITGWACNFIISFVVTKYLETDQHLKLSYTYRYYLYKLNISLSHAKCDFVVVVLLPLLYTVSKMYKLIRKK